MFKATYSPEQLKKWIELEEAHKEIHNISVWNYTMDKVQKAYNDQIKLYGNAEIGFRNNSIIITSKI